MMLKYSLHSLHVADKDFKVALMMNKLAIINSFEIIVEK
jgi:hypothetical protein